ncbi:MAG: DVUA0089 family protein [Deinococcales bacterium]
MQRFYGFARAKLILNLSLVSLVGSFSWSISWSSWSMAQQSPNPPNYMLLMTPALVFGGQVTGVLEAGDGQNFKDASYLDIWHFMAEAGYAIDLRVRANFDSFLSLYAPDGSLLSLNDDFEDGINASIISSLPQSGRYMVVVSGLSQFDQGPYAISADLVSLNDGGVLSIPSKSYGRINAEDSQDTARGLFYDAYQFNLTHDQVIAFDLWSRDLEGRLLLFHQSELILDHDDIGQQLIESLKAGDYEIWVAASNKNKYSRQDEGIYYLLSEALELAFPSSLEVGTSFFSLLETRDREMNGRYSDVFLLELSEKKRLIIRATSSTFDSYLYLYNQDGNLVAENDDSLESTNAELILELNPGQYTVVLSSYGDIATGLYQLSVVEY